MIVMAGFERKLRESFWWVFGLSERIEGFESLVMICIDGL